MKTAIIGTGKMARQHLACLRSLPGVQVVGVCDIAPGIAEKFARENQIAASFTDHRQMIQQLGPDIVHVTTPPATHVQLAADLLAAGINAFIEKPLSLKYSDFQMLRRTAESQQKVLLEDHNYLFNPPVQQVLRLVESGQFGEVNHVEVMLCLNIFGEGSPFIVPAARNPWLSLPGGAIADFVTHLAYLGHAFVGPHRAVATSWAKRDPNGVLPSDEFRALVEAPRGTAMLGFSSHTQPDAFWVRVYGTKMRASINLYDSRLTIDRIHGGPRALTPALNNLHEAAGVAKAAVGSVWRKVRKGPGAYAGLEELLRRTYAALASNTAMPISMQTLDEVNRLVSDLVGEGSKMGAVSSASCCNREESVTKSEIRNPKSESIPQGSMSQ